MNRHLYVILLIMIVFCFIAPEMNADRSKLLEHLRSKSWPWFGENCVKMCGNQPTPYKPCFNLRPGKVESVLERAGINTPVNLKADLTVIFESPEEPVDVCGKHVPTSAVKFKLNENGRAVPKRLKLGAEIYRSRPSLDWSIETGVNYTLLFWDVGLLRVRGYWSKIQKVNSTISGKRNILYAPPANPSRTVNPILIIVMKEENEFDEKLITKKCSKRVASEKGGEECREAVTALIQDGQNIVGLQIFYTDGSSLYEQYRACIEGYICSTSCISKFKEYARLEKQNIQFLQIDPESIDMYTNIRYYSMYNGRVYKGRCYRISKNAPIFEFRPRPGDNYEVDKSYKVGNRFYWEYFFLDMEFSGDDTHLTDTSMLYAILLVTPDGHVNAGDYGSKPQGCLFYANMQLPYNDSTPVDSYKIMEYTSVQQRQANNKVHYYILLFSHSQRITENPFCNGEDDRDCQYSWDLTKLPADFKLRGISWFIVVKDEYSDSLSPTECQGEGEPNIERDPPEIFKIATTEETDADPDETVDMCKAVDEPNTPPTNIPPTNIPPNNIPPTIPPTNSALTLIQGRKHWVICSVLFIMISRVRILICI